MTQEQTLELIAIDALLEKVRGMRQQNARLVQISATRLADQFELTYSFALDGGLTSFRLHIPAVDAFVPSISSIYWCAFLYENEMHDLFKIKVDGIAVDFKGNLYKTAVPFAFGTIQGPQNSAPAQMKTTTAAPAIAQAPAAAKPAPPANNSHPSAVAH